MTRVQPRLPHLQDLLAAARGVEFDLREWLGAPKLPEDPQLGHIGVHTPALSLADYVLQPASPPPAVHRSHGAFPFGLLLNDRLGDCGEAMAIHADEQLELNAGRTPPPYQDEDAELFYGEVGGYVPGHPETDQGTNNDDLVVKWREVGIPVSASGTRRKIAGSLAVPLDELMTEVALWEFGVLCRAAGLPQTAKGQKHWQLVGDPSTDPAAAVGSWGYHDIIYVSYDAERFRNVSWGTELLVDKSWDKAYAVQGFVPVSYEMRHRQGLSPSGFNWTTANAALDAVGAPK